MRRRPILFLTIVIIIIASFTFYVLDAYTPIIYNYRNRADFEAERWKSWEETENEPSLRWNMIHDLVSKFEFNGITRNKLIELLGKPDSESNNEIRYFLGMSGHGIDTGSLIFELKNDKVVNYFVWHG